MITVLCAVIVAGRDILFAYTFDVYRRANLPSDLDTISLRVYRLAKVFPKKRWGDERFTRFRSRKKTKRRKEIEGERKAGSFILSSWGDTFRRDGLSSVCLLETYPPHILRPATLSYIFVVRALFPFSSLWHVRNTKADLPEFYVSKHVIVLATRLRRLLRTFYTDSPSYVCLSEASRERMYLTRAESFLTCRRDFLYAEIVRWNTHIDTINPFAWDGIKIIKIKLLILYNNLRIYLITAWIIIIKNILSSFIKKIITTFPVFFLFLPRYLRKRMSLRE